MRRLPSCAATATTIEQARSLVLSGPAADVSLGEPRQPERREVDHRLLAAGELGHDVARRRANAEAVAREAGGAEQAVPAVDRTEHRDLVRRDVDHAGPALDRPDALELREQIGGIAQDP